VDKIIKLWLITIVCVAFAYCVGPKDNFTMFWVATIIYIPLLSIMFFGRSN